MCFHIRASLDSLAPSSTISQEPRYTYCVQADMSSQSRFACCESEECLRLKWICAMLQSDELKSNQGLTVHALLNLILSGSGPVLRLYKGSHVSLAFFLVANDLKTKIVPFDVLPSRPSVPTAMKSLQNSMSGHNYSQPTAFKVDTVAQAGTKGWLQNWCSRSADRLFADTLFPTLCDG